MGNMPDYSKGLIYTIKTDNSIYVGSTTNFTKRKNCHKQSIKTSNTNLYKTIRENDGEWDMKPYKEFSCENKTQLIIEEERVRCELNADLNMKCCYELDIKKKQKAKIWRENNKERMQKSNNIWQKTSIKRKEYIENNKDKIDLYKKEWYDKNKEYVVCECGDRVLNRCLERHKKRKVHLDKIKEM